MPGPARPFPQPRHDADHAAQIKCQALAKAALQRDLMPGLPIRHCQPFQLFKPMKLVIPSAQTDTRFIVPNGFRMVDDRRPEAGESPAAAGSGFRRRHGCKPADPLIGTDQQPDRGKPRL